VTYGITGVTDGRLLEGFRLGHAHRLRDRNTHLGGGIVKTYYFIPSASESTPIAGATLIKPWSANPTWTIDRLSVRKPYREEGHGTVLLVSICMDADQEGETLSVKVEPGGEGLNYKELTMWLRRHGFVNDPTSKYMIRYPKPKLLPQKLVEAVQAYIEESEHEDRNWWIGQTLTTVSQDFASWIEHGGYDA
jgi:hypothetical protein